MAKWISVEDKLPERWKAVLVYTPRFLNIFEAYLTDEYKWRDFAHSKPLPFDAEVTHWMPLPKPPKEVRDGN